MFETFRIQALHLTIAGALSLYTVGGTSGMVLDSGNGLTQFVPMYEGRVMQEATLIQDLLAGQDVTWYLKKLLKERGVNLDIDNGEVDEG